jgi:hypothetical protein
MAAAFWSPAVIDLAKHVPVILRWIRFTTRHAVHGTRCEDVRSIAAMREIAAELRRSANAIETEAKRREECARARLERNAILMRDR